MPLPGVPQQDLAEALGVHRSRPSAWEWAGLGCLRLHDLRHSAGTIMVETDVDQRATQHVLVHATGEEAGRCTHVVESMGHRESRQTGKRGRHARPGRRIAGSPRWPRTRGQFPSLT